MTGFEVGNRACLIAGFPLSMVIIDSLILEPLRGGEALDVSNDGLDEYFDASVTVCLCVSWSSVVLVL